MNWDSIFPAIFGFAVFIQLIYLLFVFTNILRAPSVSEEKAETLGVSVIVAAWNEIDNLKELLPLLDSQDYADFEIVVVDDRSSDGTYDYLRTNEGKFKNMSFVHVKALPEHFTAKKYAVTMGIKKATKEVVLLTDADCRPLSKNWIREMVSKLGEDKQVVLGFSPYYKYPGLLNAFIRYETFQTALQYLSFAKAGVPFMGVGRNLMYRKESFWGNKGFSTHMSLLSGDDDLFVNEVAKGSNTEVALNYDSYVSSEPKTTFDSWVTQKRRHLSVGKRYKFKDRLNLALLWLSFLACWLFLIPTFLAEPSWFVLPDWMRVSEQWLDSIGWEQYLPYTNWMRVVTGVFISWLLLRWLILSLTNKKLGLTVSSGKILFLDFLYFLYLIIFGAISMFSNPKKIKWR